MRSLAALVFAVLLPSTVLAAELSAAAKAYLDDKCAATAKAKKDAPCRGVANVTLFDMMMNEKLKAEASMKENAEPITAYCIKACEAARK